MHSKSANIGIKVDGEAQEVIKYLFESLKIDFNLCFKCHKTNPNHGGLYVNSFLKKQKQ